MIDQQLRKGIIGFMNPQLQEMAMQRVHDAVVNGSRLTFTKSTSSVPIPISLYVDYVNDAYE